MTHAVCVVPVSPLRSEPAHRSEMVSQLLFGESCSIIEQGKDHWAKVKCSYDGYEGWCQDMHLMERSEDEYQLKISSYTAAVINEISWREERMYLPYASVMPTDIGMRKSLGLSFSGETWEAARAEKNESTLTRIAFMFLNTGYLWGGKSIFGIDCSGYTQTVFRMLNIFLQRDAYQQAAQGEAVGFLQEARCGDLAFFDNAEGRITHVGILLNDQQIIHSSGKVRVDRIDSQGIVNAETGERTHKLRIIKRYF